MDDFFRAFIPLFVAMDVLGIAPLFVSLTETLSDRSRRELVTQATLTAFAIAVAFLLCGNLLFSFLGITAPDFRIGGGIVLVILAVTDLVFARKHARREPEGDSVSTMGVVPLGIPLIMGPAALTTLLITLDTYGYTLTVCSLLLNLVVVWITFRNAHKFLGLVGPGGARAIAKVASLFLAAIGVMMVRVGLQEIVSGGP